MCFIFILYSFIYKIVTSNNNNYFSFPNLITFPHQNIYITKREQFLVPLPLYYPQITIVKTGFRAETEPIIAFAKYYHTLVISFIFEVGTLRSSLLIHLLNRWFIFQAGSQANLSMKQSIGIIIVIWVLGFTYAIRYVVRICTEKKFGRVPFTSAYRSARLIRTRLIRSST